ncbi:MAG TPA: UDP-4-amino-4,6-dideoxy-N-acetyl-beta-L-altrosamine transaminase [Kofleriaceae bacterium]|nr:UDP-4-amino-4,6-dideoxy-N-acetyl-beta-L-altrosamine transaminase [Kofleriaceae bacterium]
MSEPNLPYSTQTIDRDDVAAVAAALEGPLLTQGPAVVRFERALADYLGAQHVSACSSGTAALHLAYLALGIGPGDEVVTSPITFSATAAAALLAGARVRMADVEPDTGLLDVDQVERAMTPATRAVTAVHLAGLPADLGPLRELCDRRGVWLVDDAAHALGAEYRGRPIGSGLADASTFSFHPVKHITTLEGGAVAVADPALKQRIDRLRQHGVERDPARFERIEHEPWAYEVQELGLNYRLSDVACALGSSQLAKQPRWLARRRNLAARYRQRLAAQLPAVLPPAERPGRDSAHHLFPVRIDFRALRRTRGDVSRGLAARGIGTQVHYIPLFEHPLYRRHGAGQRLEGACAYYERTLSLPMHHSMSEADVDRVVSTLAEVLS